MKLLFLGTGSSLGVPMIGCTCKVCTSEDWRDKRMRTSVFIEVNQEKILIDPGPDFRIQCLYNQITHIDSFLITHPHHDHIGGLDDTRSVYYAMGKRPLHFYLESFTLKGIQKHFDYLFPEDNNPDYHGAPRSIFKLIEPGHLFFTSKNKILPLRAFHGDMPVTGFKIENLVYLTDVKYVPEETARLIDRDTTLILSALQKEPHALHFNLEEALSFVKEVNPKITYLIHISHWMGKHAEVSRELPANVFLAYDNLQIEL